MDDPPHHGPDAGPLATREVVDVVFDVVAKMRSSTGTSPRVRLDSRLDRDLGLDSLARLELLSRIERVTGRELSQREFLTAETPRDLVALLAGAGGGSSTEVDSEPGASLQVEGTVEPPDAAGTLVEVLEWHAARHPDRPHVRLLDEEGREEATLTYGDLLAGSGSVAAGLRESGIDHGDAVALMLPTGADYLRCFVGTLLAGAVPVPIYPPARLSRIEDHLRRHARILANARTRALITVPEGRLAGRWLRAGVETLRRVVTPEEIGGPEEALPGGARRSSEDVAFLQYTSGSTGDPKGVVLRHANVLANIRAMGEVVRPSPDEVFVSWLPLYHDMGLIGAWLGSLYYGLPVVLMSPLTFLARPARWLRAIQRYEAVFSAGPNFAYELCLGRIEEEELEGLDLSSWRVAFSGAEPVSSATIRRFAERFGRHGFRESALTPVYGLAESTVGLAFPPIGRGPRVDRIRRGPLSRDGRAVPAAADAQDAVEFVSCGHPIPGHEIRIVDDAGREVAERREGRLEFRGPSCSPGYENDAEATRRAIRDAGWWDSGDLAYLAGGEVYVTGRVKDLVIRAGRNIHPAEIERAVGEVEGVRRGCVAAFSAPDPDTGTERLVVMAETRAEDPDEREAVREAVRAATVDVAGTPPDDVALVPPHTVPKTSSGKVRRSASREIFARGPGAGTGGPVSWQLVRLALSGVAARGRRGARAFVDLAYSAYAWGLLAFGVPVLGAAVLLPRRSWRWTAARGLARGLVRASGTRLRVEGRARLPSTGAYVLVANHASYLDYLMLEAALDLRCRPVAKREFERWFVTRLLFRRLGVEFVDRVDASRGAEDADRLAGVAREGRALAFFPEGTFTRQPGLLAFQSGAFVVAAKAGAPVVPVTLRGTRSLLRSEQWVLRRGQVEVRVSEPVWAEGSDWAAVLALRDAVRAEILGHCGEPDRADRSPFTEREKGVS